MPHLIVHARKCILKGLSPKQNREIPPLNYERVFELTRAFPDLPISINGGFEEVQQIKSVLDKVDGCMIGRKGKQTISSNQRDVVDLFFLY